MIHVSYSCATSHCLLIHFIQPTECIPVARLNEKEVVRQQTKDRDCIQLFNCFTMKRQREKAAPHTNSKRDTNESGATDKDPHRTRTIKEHSSFADQCWDEKQLGIFDNWIDLNWKEIWKKVNTKTVETTLDPRHTQHQTYNIYRQQCESRQCHTCLHTEQANNNVSDECQYPPPSPGTRTNEQIWRP